MSTFDWFRARLPRILADVRALVELETPTGDVTSMGAAADLFAGWLEPFGELVTTPLEAYGPLLRLVRPGNDTSILLVGHLDTVWPVGSWSQRWSEADGHVYGPGIYDMKAGLVFLPWLLEWLDAVGRPAPSIEIVVNPDEEVGSVASRVHLEAAARRCDCALVIEPTVADRCLKIARKGSGEYRITVHGRSAHQGVAPELGRNAVVEAARLVLELIDLDDADRGTTVGPNVIRGGIASNVVPDSCTLDVDVRAWTRDEQHRLERALDSLAPRGDGIRLDIGGGWNRPPMEPTPASEALYARVQSIARSLGFEVPAARWGGSSDANLVAAAGAPCLDGFGPVGAGAHQRDEHIVIDELPLRLALIAETVAALAVEPLPWVR